MKINKYYDNDKLNSKKIVSNISDSLKQMDRNISELEKSKQKTDGIINKFNIDCYKYNLVEEMSISKNRLEKNIRSILDKLNYIKKNMYLYNSEKKVDYINDILNNSDIQLKNIDKEDLNDVEVLQMNAIKFGIYNKYMLLKSDIDRQRIKTKFDKMQNIGALKKWFIKFFYLEEDYDRKKENLFMQIQEIDKMRAEFSKQEEPTKEYKILDILADIDIFLSEAPLGKKYKEEVSQIIEIRKCIDSTFSIDNRKLKETILEKKRARLPVQIDKRHNKMIKERQKAIAFLDKNGYIKGATEEKAIVSKMAVVVKKINTISENIEKIINVK